MDDLLDYSTDVSVLLSVVEGTKLGSSLAGAGVCLEDGGLTLPLCLFVLEKHVNKPTVYALSNKLASHHGNEGKRFE